MKSSGIFTFLLIFITVGNAQSLSSHQWNDRLVVILAQDQSNQLFQDQLSEFRESEPGITERRIVLYQSLPGRFQRGILRDEQWEESEELYQHLKELDSEFEVILIGLDGGVKLRKAELLTCKELFAIIDQMPMRRAEMKRNKRE